MRPFRLPNLISREELGHHRLDIQHWGAIDGVELGNIESCAFGTEHPANRAPQAIRPVLPTLRKNPHPWPAWIISRVTRTGHNLVRIRSMEVEKDFDMGKIGDAQERIGRELLRESDVRFPLTPEIVFRMGTCAFDETDGLNCCGHL